ncbi:MAG: ArnT family glycosyltransferase [Chitinophagaceae bacterium]
MRVINYNQQFWQLSLLLFFLKALVANSIELGNDEVYYYTYALQLDWNHFDHPPLIGLLIRLTTLNLYWLNDFTMRLGAILSSIWGAYFLYKSGSLFFNEKTGFVASVIYQLSVYSGVIAGLFIMPDSVQMLFYMPALYLMAKIIKQNSFTLKQGILLGLLIGLAALSKVHGLYLWGGFGLFILLRKRAFLQSPGLYIGVLITIICLTPIVYWNIANDFITYRFHANRVTNQSIQWDSFFREIVGEILYQNPVIFACIAWSAFYYRSKITQRWSDTAVWISCMSVPMLFLFWYISLHNDTFPHWSGPAYIPLFLVAANFLTNRFSKLVSFPLKMASYLVLIVITAAISLSNWAPFHLGSKEDAKMGEYCPTLDISGWNDFGIKFKALHEANVANNRMEAQSPILVGNWFPGGHLLFYVANKTHQPLMGIGEITKIHKFAWLNNQLPNLKVGQNAYCIVPSNLPFNELTELKSYFISTEKMQIPQIRGGKMVRYFTVYELIGLKKPLLIPKL